MSIFCVVLCVCVCVCMCLYVSVSVCLPSRTLTTTNVKLTYNNQLNKFYSFSVSSFSTCDDKMDRCDLNNKMCCKQDKGDAVLAILFIAEGISIAYPLITRQNDVTQLVVS